MSIISEISAGLVWCKVGGSAYMDRDDPLGSHVPQSTLLVLHA